MGKNFVSYSIRISLMIALMTFDLTVWTSRASAEDKDLSTIRFSTDKGSFEITPSITQDGDQMPQFYTWNGKVTNAEGKVNQFRILGIPCESSSKCVRLEHLTFLPVDERGRMLTPNQPGGQALQDQMGGRTIFKLGDAIAGNLRQNGVIDPDGKVQIQPQLRLDNERRPQIDHKGNRLMEFPRGERKLGKDAFPASPLLQAADDAPPLTTLMQDNDDGGQPCAPTRGSWRGGRDPNVARFFSFDGLRENKLTREDPRWGTPRGPADFDGALLGLGGQTVGAEMAADGVQMSIDGNPLAGAAVAGVGVGAAAGGTALVLSSAPATMPAAGAAGVAVGAVALPLAAAAAGVTAAVGGAVQCYRQSPEFGYVPSSPGDGYFGYFYDLYISPFVGSGG